jgi:hypothetical protein
VKSSCIVFNPFHPLYSYSIYPIGPVQSLSRVSVAPVRKVQLTALLDRSLLLSPAIWCRTSRFCSTYSCVLHTLQLLFTGPYSFSVQCTVTYLWMTNTGEFLQLRHPVLLTSGSSDALDREGVHLSPFVRPAARLYGRPLHSPIAH